MKTETFQPEPGLPEGHFDVVVVGSGMGGLSAALLLAKEGFKVCVLEQHYRPGGCLHRFFRKRVPFDTGFHYLGGLDEGGTLNQYFKFLGIRDRLSIHHLDPDGFDVLRFPDYEFRVPAKWPAYVKRLQEEFPSERSAIEKFAHACDEICRESFAYSFQRPKEELGIYTSVTVGGFLDSLGVSRRLKAVLCAQSFLYGVPPKDAPLELHAHVIDSMLQGPAGLDGGGEALAQTMVKAIQEKGGVIRTRTPVTALEVNDGRITNARTGRGEAVFGRVFISNAHPHHTLDLLPAGVFKPAYVNRVRDMRNGMSCIAGYFLSDAPEAPKRNHNLYISPGWDIDEMYESHGFTESQHSDEKALFVTFPSDRERDWNFPRMVLTLGVMPYREVAKFENSRTGNRGDEYGEFKSRHAEKLKAALESYLPDHAGHLRLAEVSTPLTNRDYTRTGEGAMYGLRHGMDRWGKYALGSRTKIPNLYLTGHSVLMPGVVGVTIGAFITCSYLLGFEPLFDRVARA